MPAHRDDLLLALLGRLLAIVDPLQAEQIAHEVGAEYGRSLALQMAPGDAPRSLRSAMQSVADALTAQGFAAHGGVSGSPNSIIRDHCPFGDAAIDHPVLCAADRGLVEGLLSGLCRDGVPVQLSSRARRRRGLRHCRRLTPATSGFSCRRRRASGTIWTTPRLRPLRPEAARAMSAWITSSGAGDPGRVHAEGHVARDALEEAREAVAVLLGTTANRVVFTSGGTEAANTAIFAAGVARDGAPTICADVEHSCVRDAARRHGVVLLLEVDSKGRIDLGHLEALLASDPANRPALVNCQWCNHEVGTLQPVAEVVACCRSAGVPVHVDAAAALGHVPVDLDALGADYVSVSAHKLGGPTGIGALVVRRGLRLEPFIVGGAQERARRGGLENLIGIVGFGAAAAALSEPGRLETEQAAARRLTGALVEAATSLEDVAVLGDPVAGASHRERRSRRRPGRGGAPRSRSLRHRCALRLGVLVRVHRAVPGARRDGSRPRSFAQAVGWLVDDRGGCRGLRRGLHACGRPPACARDEERLRALPLQPAAAPTALSTAAPRLNRKPAQLKQSLSARGYDVRVVYHGVQRDGAA